jgi:hypothetical protein
MNAQSLNLKISLHLLQILSTFCSKVEIIHYCLNTELGAYAYGFKSYISSDKMAVLTKNEEVCQLIEFFKSKSYQSILTEYQIRPIRIVVKFADKGKIDILWTPAGLRKLYDYLKQ